MHSRIRWLYLFVFVFFLCAFSTIIFFPYIPDFKNNENEEGTGIDFKNNENEEGTVPFSPGIDFKNNEKVYMYI